MCVFLGGHTIGNEIFFLKKLFFGTFHLEHLEYTRLYVPYLTGLVIESVFIFIFYININDYLTLYDCEITI